MLCKLEHSLNHHSGLNFRVARHSHEQAIAVLQCVASAVVIRNVIRLMRTFPRYWKLEVRSSSHPERTLWMRMLAKKRCTSCSHFHCASPPRPPNANDVSIHNVLRRFACEHPLNIRLHNVLQTFARERSSNNRVHRLLRTFGSERSRNAVSANVC